MFLTQNINRRRNLQQPWFVLQYFSGEFGDSNQSFSEQSAVYVPPRELYTLLLSLVLLVHQVHVPERFDELVCYGILVKLVDRHLPLDVVYDWSIDARRRHCYGSSL